VSIFGGFSKKVPDKWQVGDTIANRYQIHKILTGGMGVVYVCYDFKEKTLLALKTFHNNFLLSRKAQDLFKHEALVWIELKRQANVLSADYVTRLEDRLFIALEYIKPDKQGRNTLTHYLGNLALPDIMEFSIQFCCGMEYAYSKGIDAHRDIKPDNIMVTPDKTVKITDFGLAKAFQAIQLTGEAISTEQNPSLSVFQNKGKQICGTLPYMAPEQFDGYADKRSDIYSFGITLYEMVTGGNLPFTGRTIQEWEKLHKQRKIPIITDSPFPIIPKLFSTIQKCLEKNPNKRYQDFIDIRKELQSLFLQETGEVFKPAATEEIDTVIDLSNKGMSFSELGKYEQALVCYNKALKLNPKDAETWCNKAATLNSMGKYQEALNCSEKALALNSGDALSWNNKAIALWHLGKAKEGIACLDKALAINPRYAEIWCTKGVLLGAIGKPQEALKCVNEAIKLNPNLAQAHEVKRLIIEDM